MLVAPFVVAASGILSVPLEPDIPGMDAFAGASLYTSRWPKGGFDLTGKRVGVIGTGSTGVQIDKSDGTAIGRWPAFDLEATGDSEDDVLEKLMGCLQQKTGDPGSSEFEPFAAYVREHGTRLSEEAAAARVRGAQQHFPINAGRDAEITVSVLRDSNVRQAVHRAPRLRSGNSRGAPICDWPRLESKLGLRPGPHDVMEENLAKCEFPRIAPHVEAQSVHHIGESNAGTRIGEPERATGAEGSKRLIVRTERELRKRLDNPSENAVSTCNTLPRNPLVGGTAG
jgi:hypothetical protein